MKTSCKTLYILDGNALLHRAWHAVPPLATKDGLIVNAVYGFTNVVEKIRYSFKPDYLCVAWDLPGKTFRHEAVESYKATRAKKEPELYAQIPMIQELLLSYHVPSYSAPGYEADDVIGTVAEIVKKQNVDVVIVTGDMDALQLVDDHVSVLSFIKGVSETKVYDEAAVVERVGLKPEQLIDYKALRGDTSDNIAGIAGIGEKGALELIQKFETVDGIFEALKKGEVPSKFAKKLEGKEKVAEESKMLVTIIRDVPIKFHLDETVYQSPNLDSLLELFRKYEFRSLLRKYSTAIEVPEMEAPPIDDMRGSTSTVSSRAKRSAAEGSLRSSSNSSVEMTKKIELVRDLPSLESALKKIKDSTIGILLGTQTPDLFGATHAAFAISDGLHTVCVMSPSKQLFDALHKKISRTEKVVVHDEKFLMHTLDWKFSNEVFDVMIASYLLNAGSRSYDIGTVLEEELGVKNAELSVSYTSEKDYKKLAELAQYLPALEKVLRKKLHETEQEHVYDHIEMPLIPVLYKMEEKGIEVDVKALATFSKELAKNITALEKKIRDIAGEDVNVNSPSQLAHVLFETLGLSTKHIKKTKTGFSTAASELEKLMDEHEIVPMISEYRELAKLQSTYVEALPRQVAKDGRIHTTYNQTIAATGRLSSIDPNLQNIPIRTELGREIRKAFVAAKDCLLVSADYSQIELRLVAILAKDKPFIDAFTHGADIHTRTASEILEVPESEVTKDQRRAAKAINFGVLYGMGPRSLARGTGLSMTEAKTFIEKYFTIHSAVREYLDTLKKNAHDDGFVQTYFGRRRYFPEIESGMQMLVAQAERMAQNMPIQGTQADIVKMAMLSVDGWLKQSQLRANILLQVHDELVLEVHKDDVELVCKGLKEMMEGVATFEVPLEVEVKKGENWGEMEEV
ncbi:DNA polymerase I [Candidatus Uhrbacteria bacterium RIFOXYB2_FULL_45_11]|uniref:DNA polymerase I n=1 Tax=Candidatus Uhrbacteria bacterium RIFOXYB2_FULL_45_11 TaxID=1802421 RepID=A0A1F7WAV1_9BACT|nr:MAG: DNA polymerase I [Candidatus Uhrbacteria bacterium RIFOXYB2_FULL_45_11]